LCSIQRKNMEHEDPIMKRLWAPWRMKYVQSQAPVTKCVFCEALRLAEDARNLLVFRGQNAFVILNRFPYTSGHLLVVANVHLPTLEELEGQTRCEMMELATKGMTVLRKVYQPQAFNFGANIGQVAGAGIAEHVHLHIVPRWGGDTNFMSALAETRVLPESLDDSYRRILAAWNIVV
jgi:ATP adenylyltransferase